MEPFNLSESAPIQPSTTRAGALRWLAFLLAVVGCLICVVLLRMSLGGPGDTFSSTVCAPGARINCDYVLASSWAKLGPLPSAAVGLAYFATLAAWYLIVGVPTHSARRWWLVPLSLTIVGNALSAFFMYVMAVQLPVWCTWCVGAHLVNFALILVTLLLRPGTSPPLESTTHLPSTGRAIGVLAGSLALFVILSLAVIAYQMQVAAHQLHKSLLEATNNPEYVMWKWRSEPVNEIPVLEDDVTLGASDAPRTLVVFSDFECEKCGWFVPYGRRLVQAFPKTLRIVYKHYPVSPECNAEVREAFHRFACDAANAALAACRIGSPAQAVEYHELLYQNANLLGSRPYLALAKKAGLDIEKFKGAMSDSATRSRLARDIELAARLGVKGTPTMFLDGRRLPTWNIRSDEIKPRIDVARTDELWNALLKAPPQAGS